MLYDFKNEHPEININQFLSKTSKFFQQYILRGLEEVQAEKDGRILRDGECCRFEKIINNSLIPSIENEKFFAKDEKL